MKSVAGQTHGAAAPDESRVVVVFTIDTECDHDPFWVKSNPLTFDSVCTAIPDRLQPLFERYGARPTYLLASEVLEDDRCVEVLNSLGSTCELGTHLHAEYVNPFRKYAHDAGTKPTEWACSYSLEVEFAKLENLTKLFTRRMGHAPLSYRAGRFGANAQTVKNLCALGYKVDTSVTPHLIWESADGHRLDFSDAPEQPYFPARDSIRTRGAYGILEVPVTIVEEFSLRELTGLFRKSLQSSFSRRVFRPVWLRPSSTSLSTMKSAALKVQRKYSGLRQIVINVMFHSMELVPGASPYARTAEESRVIFERISGFLDFCVRVGWDFCTLSEVHALFAAEHADR